MEYILSLLEQFSYQIYLLSRWDAILDVALVTLIIYGTLRLVQGTRAIQVLRGFLIVVASFFIFFSTSTIELPALRWLINNILPALFLSIPVIFQPELRRALERVGEFSQYFRFRQREQLTPVIEAIVTAGHRLSQRRHGALIVFERDTGLQEYIDTGVPIDGHPSSEILLTIFDKHTELHDGAIIIRNGRIAAAACVMPLSTGNLSDRQIGLRHRAALGISEVSDAVSFVVSEETGQFSITHNGRILRRQDPERLSEILQAFLERKSLSTNS